jgi:hypothetical protein
MVKSFRKVFATNFVSNVSNKINIKFMLVGSEFSTSSLAPILGQYQIPMVDFSESYSQLSLAYSSGIETTIKLAKTDAYFNFDINSPRLTFFINQFYLDYGFNFEDFVYQIRFLSLEDLWFLVNYYSNKEFMSLYQSARIVFGFLYSVNDLKIIILKYN